MANTTYDTIKSMKPAPWSKSTVADGNALNQNFLEPTHQKDLTLAAAIDQVKNTVDEYNEIINEINNIADTAQHQAQEAENSVVDLDANLNIVSAGLADAASAISALETNKQDKIYVDSTTISGDGSHDNPYTVIGGGGGGGPVPTIVGNMGVSAAYVSENNQYVIGLSGTKNLVFESSADTIVFASSAAGKYNFEVNPELVNKWNAGTSAFTNNGFSGIGTSSSRIGVDETGMSTSYKYGWNPQLHKWSEINEGGGTGTTYNFDNGTNGTLSGNGHDVPIAVNTDVLATKNWVSEQQYIANVSIDSTYLSGDGATHPIGINNSYTEHWNEAYNVSESYKLASARYDAHSALSATKLDKSIWDNNSGKFVTSAGLDQNTQYAMTTNGWAEIQGGGGTDYDIVGNNGVSAKKDTANNQYIVGLSGDYVKKSGDTMTGGLTISAATGNNILAVTSAATQLGASRQTESNFGQNNNAMGTNWIGVDANNRGFFKFVRGGSVGELNGNSLQMSFSPNAGNGEIVAKCSQNGERDSVIVNVEQSGYNSMETFDPTNGPNYMLRKTANGFAIGAKVVNVTALPGTTDANTYYFIYDQT